MRLGFRRNVERAVFSAAAVVLFTNGIQAAPFVWDGDGDVATGAGAPSPDAGEIAAGEAAFKFYDAGNNYVGDPAAGPGIADSVTFGPPVAAGAVNVAYNTSVAAASITVNQAPIAYEFEAYGAGKLTLAAGGSITLGSNTPAVSFKGPIELNGSATFTSGATASSFNFTGATVTGLNAGTLNLVVNSGTSNTVGVISGPIDVVRPTGAGALTFAGQSNYTGSTTIYGGTTIASVNNALPNTTILTVGNGATAGTLRLDGGSSLTIGGLVNGGTSNTNGINTNSTTLTSTVTVNATQYSFFNGRLGATSAASQNMNFVKSGPANFTMAVAAQSYTGSTSVLGGTLEIDSGQLLNTTGLTVNGGRFLYRSSTAYNKPTILTAGTFGGTGSINTAISIGANVTISPGGDVDNVTGVLTESISNENYQAGLTFAPDGTYHYDLDAATGDLLTVTGALSLTATNIDPFVINLYGTGLTIGNSYQRTLASAGSISGFSADKFLVQGGTGSVSQVGNTLVLNFTAIPEPASLGLLTACGAMLSMRRRQK